MDTEICLVRCYLFGKQLLAQRVQCDELASKESGFQKPFSNQHDLADQSEVWHYHSTRSETEELQLFYWLDEVLVHL